MCVDVLWILTSDASSTLATSTLASFWTLWKTKLDLAKSFHGRRRIWQNSYK